MTKSEILQDLRDKIISEHYAQGQSLVERDLCESYHISRTPIREVLWSLVVDGIVEQRPARGFAVRKLDWEQIVEIYQAREAVEGMAARIASRRSLKPNILNLKELRDELEQIDIEKNVADGPRIGRMMHKEIIEAASNNLLSETYKKLSYLSALTTNLAKKSILTEKESKQHHLDIMNAIISGNPDKSEYYMREHLRITCRNVIEMLYPQVFSMFEKEKLELTKSSPAFW